MEEHRPKNFRGRPFGVGDVIVINQQGEITAYFVDKDAELNEAEQALMQAYISKLAEYSQYIPERDNAKDRGEVRSLSFMAVKRFLYFAANDTLPMNLIRKADELHTGLDDMELLEIVTTEEFEQAQKVIMLQHGNHQTGNYTKHQYPLKGKVYCGYCQKLMKYRVLKKLGPSFNCRFSATAVDSPCKRIPISEEILEHIVRNALTEQIKQAEHILEILRERERKALICFSALERQEEKLSEEKAEIVKQRVALYEQYADRNMSKEEFIRQRDAYRVQEDDKMEQIQRLRTEKNQIFLPVRKDADNLQTVVSAAEEAGDVMHLSQNVVETFIDRIEVFNDGRVKIRFTFEDTLKSYEAE